MTTQLQIIHMHDQCDTGNTDLGKVREVSSSFEFENESLDDLLEASAGDQILRTPFFWHMHLCYLLAFMSHVA